MSQADSKLDWDDGVASERTVLSWERTTISTFAVAVIVLRAGIVHHELGVAIPLTVLLVAAGATEWLFSRSLDREHDRPLAHGAILHERAFLAIGVVTVITAVASIPLAFGG